MMTKTSTKRAMLGSAISLLLCFAMLVGTTFAWFTDNVASTNNIIKSGNLDVELYYMNSETTDWTKVTEDTNIFKKDTLWEPGHAEVVKLKVVNEGSLALKYQLGVNVASEKGSTNVNGEEFKLSHYIKYGIVEGEQNYNRDTAIAAVDATAKALEVVYDSGTINLVPKTDGSNANEKIVTMVVYMPTSVGNEANFAKGKKAPEINLGINLIATQMEYEKDSFDIDYDKSALYPAVNSSKVPAGSTTGTPIEAEEVTVIVPAGAEEGNYKLEVTNAMVTTNGTETTVSYDISLYKDGEKVSGVNIPVEIYVGKPLNITEVTHNGNAISNYNYDLATGIVSFETNSFSPFAITYNEMEADYFVETAEELVKALEKSSEGEVIALTNNIKIEPANMSNAYGTTGINVKNGQTIEGNGFTIDIKGAGGTWDSGISTTGGIIRNVKVTGSFRGIFINHNSTYSAPVVLENVIIDGTVYTISCDQATNNGLTATNCTFNGWTSYAETLGNAKFNNCKFGEGSGYAYCRPYANTAFVGCSFEEGFQMDARAAVTLEKCTIGNEAITADNYTTLVTANSANASVK